MKQLKFMLAAAAAFGIATAQADTQLEKTEISSENFDAVTTLNDTAAVLALDGFSYEGATASDNESVVVAGGAKNSANALKVNTGTDPLLRKIDPTTGNAVALDATKKVYIDTMVQFTVTPEGDTVTATDGDKLMIYLKEVPEVKAEDGSVATPASTKLMVKAAKYAKTGQRPPYTETFEAQDVEVKGVNVVAGEWYSLSVEALLNDGVLLFKIKIGDTELYTDSPLYTDEAGKFFPSLVNKGAEGFDSTLDAVGFAGEGMVDELVFSKDVEQETSVDFTFAINRGTGVSAVAWTVDGTAQTGYSATVSVGQTIAITDVTYEDWYVADGVYAKNWSMTAAEDVASITVGAKAISSGEGAFDVEEGQTPPTATEVAGALQITNPQFMGSDDAAQAALEKGLNWAKSTGQAPTALNDVAFKEAAVTNADNTVTTVLVADGPTAEAYLLNCENNEEALATAKQEFKFSADDLAELFDLTNLDPELSIDNKYNGTVILEGKGELSGQWEVRSNGHKFFRARLVK